jgi:hypothetical protein
MAIKKDLKRSTLLNHLSRSTTILIPHRYKSLLPSLYSTENQKNPIVHLKFFNLIGSQSWLLIEYDPKQHLAFGLVDLGMHFPELGYFSLHELESMELPIGQKIERDIHFKPCLLSEVKKALVS